MKTILGTMTFSDQVDQDSAAQMVQAFRQAGHTELDTAFVYNNGQTEELLGRLNQTGCLDGTAIASKANPSAPGGLSPDSIDRQCTTSLQRLGLSSLDLYYLHMPDLSVPVIDSLRSVAKLHEQGRIKRFGLSNYAAWQVAEIVEICRAEGWLAPCVYQGMYNALTRDVERELLPCLANYDMAFHVYNPLAGGLLSGKHTAIDALPDSGRFASFTAYQERYWKPAYFDVINGIADSCRAEGIEPAAAALRWLVHHSALASGSATQAATQAATPARTGESTAGTQVEHGIIIGASTFSHFEKNLAAIAGPALPASLVDAFDNGWLEVRPACIKYFRP